MIPNPKVGGWCGILAGVGLAVETTLWIASGWTPATFSDPTSALAFLTTGGTTLRWGVAAGFTNLVFLVIFIASLSARLGVRTPTLAIATLWFGIIGVNSHLLVPLSHWYGVPAFVDAAARDPQAARSAWTAFYVVGHEAAGGAGSLFMGLSMLCAGCAIVVRQELSPLLGWLGVLTGTLTVLTLFSAQTPISTVAGALFMPSLILAMAFRVMVGMALTEDRRGPATHGSESHAAVA
jgi:hypothetical protein